MSKYTTILSSLYSVFASANWQNEDIKAIPSNYTGEINVTEYIRVSVLYGGSNPLYQNFEGISGMVIIDIFVPAGTGPLRANQISDILDSYFVSKTVGSVQMFTSSLRSLGRDRDNPSLDHSQYTITFSYNGA
jgi:hypothetical protein